MKAPGYFRQDPGAPLLLARLFGKTRCFEKTPELRSQDGGFGDVIFIKKIRLCIVQKHGRADHFIECDKRRRHHGLGVVFRRHGIARRIQRVDVDRPLLVNGFVRDRALTGFQACVAETVGHPSVCFGAHELVRRMQKPHITAADPEILACATAEQLQYLGGSEPLGGGTGEVKQKFLKRVVFTGSICLASQYLFGSRTLTPLAVSMTLRPATSY